MRRFTMALAAIAMATFSQELVAQDKPATPTGVQIKDGVFTDAKGMTLYTYARDSVANKSVCAGQCLQNWPLLAATDTDKDVGDWKVITRDDGKKMWAYKGKPIYYFVQDKAPGDKIGDGRGGVWHIAKP
jgi:predicted lipoprotein with Yx(FWY)xxD motif